MESTGEDSGLEFEDNSNVEDSSLQQTEAIDETDEGISVAGNVSINFGAPCFMPRFHQPEVGGQLNIDEIQAGFYQQQQQPLDIGEMLFPDAESSNSNSNSAVFEQQQPNDDIREVPADEIPPIGDDNNNDRPDDVNNNTTDPQLQQLQQEQQLFRQQQLLLQQQQQQQRQEPRVDVEQALGVATVNDSSESTNLSEVISIGGSEKKDNDKKDKRKKKKKKKKKNNKLVTVVGADGVFKKHVPSSIANDDEDQPTENGPTSEQNENDVPEEEVEIEYVPEKLELSVFDPMYRAFANVFENFRISDTKKRDDTTDDAKRDDVADTPNLKKVPKVDDDDDVDEKKNDEKPKLSKRKLKKLTRLSIAELKQVVPRPDVVEMHDVTARDPKLLVHLKSYRNTVPVPRHWCYKRKYLQGKRGIEKPPFDLPGFIKKTGIMEMRAALAEKEETKNLKAKMREKVRPKMGKIDIDYQKLHDAFFKWQSKPKMTIHGDLYYEGKEFETRMKDKKPGELSDDLRTALGMPVGPNCQRVPPPWLIAMQRYGPPPSYPHLKVPGLNAPIPEGCTFGYHAGGWGKPPVDEFGRPLYGDVFGITGADAAGGLEDDTVDKTLWGELESEEEAESEEEEEEEEEKEGEEEGVEQVEETGMQTPAEGLQTPSGFSSIPAGLETPELIELRKKRIEQDMEGSDTPSLYTVLPEKRVDRITGSMMASTHVYDLTGVKDKGPRGMNLAAVPGQDQGRVELNLDPSELDLVDNEGTLAARYEQQLKEQQSHLQKEDLSDMVAEHAAKQKSKRKRQSQQQDVKQAKKYKEFKF